MNISFEILLTAAFLITTCSSVPTSSCPTCNIEKCPKSAHECVHGLIKDHCGCCKEGVCLLHEKEKCMDLKFFTDIVDTSLKRFSVCGEDMECALRTDVKAGEIPDSVCLCLKEEVSCGKDNVTYRSLCQLREAGTELEHVGPCKVAPEISSEPKDPATVPKEEKLALDCEAKGFPVPEIVWEFEGLNGLFKTLPGDDSSVVVHTRGGPESLTVSSWVMIDSLRQTDAGNYICVARNSEGVSRAITTVNVM
ncbi:hypothetical protein RUM44_000374 [Polyplax serrata]|uniref:Ig-like domain-containing protein n=1 Tax=Polyplax serrata TaxID=468196 RepID=A0ABR1B593_POLSC